VDSVDTIAKYILGEYLLNFQKPKKVITRFSDSQNMWLNRSAILFQLSYKQKRMLISYSRMSHSKEFFIQKKQLAGHYGNMQNQIQKL
jgi:3-methyladenine DNA glycosylase AlkD